MSYIGAISPLELGGQSTRDIDQVEIKPPFLRLNDAAELGRGLWYSVGAGGAQTLGLAAAGAWELAPVSQSYREQMQASIFGGVTETRNYWRDWYKDSQSSTMGGQILRGLGEFGGQMVYGGAAGAGFVGGLEASLQAVESGKTSGEALALGALKGTVNAVSVALPFKVPLLAGSGALSATAQRLGYGIASNVVPGIAERAGEKALLEQWGYTEEAATKNAFDPTAMAIDAIFGVTLGAGARFLDIRAERKNAALIAEQNARGEMEQQAPTGQQLAAEGEVRTAPTVERAPVDVVPTGQAFDAIEGRINQRLAELGEQSAARPFDRGEARALDSRLKGLQYDLQRISTELPAIDKAEVQAISRDIRAADPRISAWQALAKAEQQLSARNAAELGVREGQRAEITRQIDDITQKLDSYNYAKAAEAELSRTTQKLKEANTPGERMEAAKIDDPDLLSQAEREQAAQLQEFRSTITQEQMDGALAKNLQLMGDDMAGGEPASGIDLGRHRAQMAEMAAAMDEGRAPNMEVAMNGKYSPDPRQGKKLEGHLKTITKELTAEQREGLGNGDPTDAQVSGDFKSITTTRAQQSADMKIEQEAFYKSLGDDAKIYDDEGNQITVAEFKKQQAAIMAKANDEVATVESLVGCMIKGL